MGIRNYTGRQGQIVGLLNRYQADSYCVCCRNGPPYHLPTNSLLPWERRPITIREDGDAGNGKGIDEKDGVWRKKYVDG